MRTGLWFGHLLREYRMELPHLLKNKARPNEDQGVVKTVPKKVPKW